MKRLFIYISILLLGFYTTSCKKEHLTNQSNGSPVFSFNGIVGGAPVYLQAGANNYYMYSSYTQDSAGVYNYTGSLKEYNCSSNCPPSIQFIINNYHTLSTGAAEPSISTALANSYYSYLTPGGTPDSLTVTFTPTQGPYDSIASYTWNFGDGTTKTINSSTLNPITHSYTHVGNYNSSLSVLFGGNIPPSSLSNTLNIGDTTVSLNCVISIGSYDTAFTATVSGGSGNYSYTWNFGDPASGQNTSTVFNPSHIFSDTNTTYTVSVTVTDKVTLNSVTSKALAISSTPTYYPKNLFNYSTSKPAVLPNQYGLSNATVIYTDASGDIYSSNNALQPDSSFLQITSVSNYQNNENGQSTKQLHVKFDCIVYDNKGNTLTIKNGNAVIAVAYK